MDTRPAQPTGVSIEEVTGLRERTALQGVFHSQPFWVAVALLLICLVMSWLQPQAFASADNLYNITRNFAFIGIMALGMTAVILTGGIDLSVGSIMGVVGVVCGLILQAGQHWLLAIVGGLGAGLLAGGINGGLVAYAGLPSLVVTIGTLALYRGVAQIMLEERGVSNFPEWYQSIGFGTIAGTPVPWCLLIFGVLFIGFAVFLHGTHWGRSLFAIGNNREAARFSGIDVGRSILGVFATSGAMCSVAAVVLTAYLASARADTATGLELPVITAVVLGGVNIFGGSGTMGGVLIAVFVLAFVQNALGLAGVTPEEQQIVTGAVLIATLVLFRASGLVRARVAAPRRSRKAG
jgi:ribose/xylose/arabinose/galactoside ABC-type transport system permease subunit